MATGDERNLPQVLTSPPENLQLEEWQGFPYIPVQVSEVLSLRLTFEFRHVFGLLYAVKATDERSLRALRLTTRALELNAGNPTVWMLRREIVEVLANANKGIWESELAFLTSVIDMHPKNYQAWQHRRFAAEGADMMDAEIGMVDIVLNQDSKNYHAWSHRQWLVLEHGIYDGELATTEWFLKTDVRNNSAWNHRWLITGLKDGRRDEEEMNFAFDMMMKAPRNEAVWNYIHALARVIGTEDAKRKAKEVLDVDAACIPARRFLVLNEELPENIRKHCEILLCIDKARERYWKLQLVMVEKNMRG